VSDNSDNLVLSLLRAIRTDIGEIKETLRETQMRLDALELNYVRCARNSIAWPATSSG